MNKQLKLMSSKYKGLKYHVETFNNFELLIGTILSAQCTDERVTLVMRELRKKYKNPEDVLKASIKEFEEDIKSTGFYRNKTKYIRGCCKLLIEAYNGEIPSSMEELLKFPGISRKTANVILQNGFDKIEGIVLDTHGLRVAYRLGWTSTLNSHKAEKELMNKLPKKYWKEYPNLVKAHGKKLCKAPIPFCSKCFLNKICPKKGVKKNY